MSKTSLFELLGQPVAAAPSDLGTRFTASPETYDDAGVLPSVADCGTLVTATPTETYDDDAGVLASLAECGTMITRAVETYDDHSVLTLA